MCGGQAGGNEMEKKMEGMKERWREHNRDALTPCFEQNSTCTLATESAHFNLFTNS